MRWLVTLRTMCSTYYYEQCDGLLRVSIKLYDELLCEI